MFLEKKMMSQEYVKKKSLEALDASGANKQEAAQLLRVWAESDTELKNLLINPFLPNICALAIQSASITHAITYAITYAMTYAVTLCNNVCNNVCSDVCNNVCNNACGNV